MQNETDCSRDNDFKSISWATSKDINNLLNLFQMLYLHSETTSQAMAPEEIRNHIELLLSPAAPHRLAIAWSNDQKAIGLAAAAIFISVNDPRPYHRVQVEMKELFVLEEYRNQGVGEKLVAWVEAYAQEHNADRFDWHVDQRNTKGISFYERIGARIVENRLSMRKNLKEDQL